MRHSALRRTEHRPWPVPGRPWTWRQSWLDLLFLHWPVPVEELRPLVPASLNVQEYEGTSWIGVVPFRMSGVMRRPLPDLPWVSAFPEVNLRLYVERDGKPGVWFLSLDASSALAVWTARRFFHLPYHRARMSIEHTTRGVRFSSSRLGPTHGPGFAASYQSTSDVRKAAPDTLEHWLTERYCLYAQSPGGKLYRTEVHHHPWPLQSATVEIQRNELCEPHRLTVKGHPALVHFSRSIDVVAWKPELVVT